MTSAVYEVGEAIVANRPSASGDAVDHYSVSTVLPDGLVLDAATGIISGTPTTVSASTVYEVTAENAGGRATARVQIEVRSTPAAPSGLTYRESSAVYRVGQAITDNAPASSGGPITSYSISPALPAGLSLDMRSGVISGTPTAIASTADYAITGTNATGSAVATLHLTVGAALAPPVSVVYSMPRMYYVVGEPAVPNTALVTGGTPSTFNISPSLPAGMSLNATTGAITGTPSVAQPLTTYVIRASNSDGFAWAHVQLAFNGPGTWQPEAPLLVARYSAAAVVLANGKVLVIGGYSAGFTRTASAELFDPASNTWTPAASLLVPRAEAKAIVLQDGRVLVVGGATSMPTMTEIYDPASDTWQSAGNMSVTRNYAGLTLLPTGKVLVTGGSSSSTVSHDTAELYDPVSNSWSLMATRLTIARTQHAAQLLAGSNKVLLTGGLEGSLSHSTSAELFSFDDSAASIRLAATVPAGNAYVSALLADGSVLATGDLSATAVRFDPSTSTFTTSVGSAIRGIPMMTALADGRVLVAGGNNLTTADIYNPYLNNWTPAATMAGQHTRSPSVLLQDGSVLVIGGITGSTPTAGVERFTP